MPTPEWKKLITGCMASTTYMALATHGPDGLWVNPVYFAWDGKRALCFISELDCVHIRNLQASLSVNCAIFPTNQTGDVFGTYVKGAARVLSDAVEKKTADEIYYGRVYPNDAEVKARNADGYRLSPSWHFVKIEIDRLWYFDTRYFEEKRVEVPLAAF